MQKGIVGTDRHQTYRGQDLPEDCVDVVTLDGEVIVGVTGPWLGLFYSMKSSLAMGHLLVSRTQSSVPRKKGD